MAVASMTTGYLNPTNQVVWGRWTETGTSTGPYTITYDNTWDTWTTGTTTTINRAVWYPAQEQIWQRWEVTPYAEQEYYQHPAVREPTQAELDAAQRRREEASARALANRQRMIGAEDRALELFRSLLTADQIQTMDRDGEVWVKGSSGGFYVIETRDGRVHGNIRAVDEHGCMLGRLCVQPSMYDHEEGAALPTSDGHVGQLLAIRFNEPDLLDHANWSGRRPCQQPVLRAA